MPRFRLFIDGQPSNIDKVFDTAPALTSFPGGEWREMTADQAAKKSVKDEARRRIFRLIDQTGLTPESDLIVKELNMAARGVELVKIQALDPENYTPELAAEASALQATWDTIKAIRSKSNEIEAAYGQMTPEEQSSFDPTEDGLWNP